MKIDVYTANAFCHNGEGGNGAGIVLEAENLSRTEKQFIATEMGLSETVFVSPSEKADWRLEYFTPAAEVELCGHATIATFAMKHAMEGVTGNFVIETLAGLLEIRVESDGRVMMQQRNPEFFDVYDAKVFGECLPTEWILKEKPIQAVSTGLKDILMPIDNVEHLRLLQPDFDKMANLNRQQGVVGIHAFALTDKKDYIAECRNFAPLYDIDEESATGTSNCALACYLHRYVEKREEYRFLQGVSMGRTSEIVVRIDAQGDRIESVKVGGYGKTTGTRSIEI